MPIMHGKTNFRRSRSFLIVKEYRKELSRPHSPSRVPCGHSFRRRKDRLSIDAADRLLHAAIVNIPYIRG